MLSKLCPDVFSSVPRSCLVVSETWIVVAISDAVGGRTINLLVRDALSGIGRTSRSTTKRTDTRQEMTEGPEQIALASEGSD